MIRFLPLLLSLALWPALGCSSNRAVSLASWQKEFDQYAANEAAGDLSFLRESSAGAAYPQFAVFGSKSLEVSSDVIGVFLGRQSMSGADWLVFLAASLKKGNIEDIRVVLRSVESGKPQWVLGEPDPQALQQYKSRHEVSSPSKFATTFPMEADVFRVEVSDYILTVQEEKSGARWRLFLNAKKPAP